MSIKCLAEGIILQSIADLWTESETEDSIIFLTGDGFKTCAEIADIGISERIKLLTLVSDAIKLAKNTRNNKKTKRLIKASTKVLAAASC